MAIQSLTDLKALINSTIQDNTTNDISGSDVQTALINAIDTLDSLEGFINVHKANGQTTITAYGSKALARAAVPDDCKKEGVVIAYKISTGWLIEQNLDATAGTWGDDASWQTIGPVSVSQNNQTGHTEIHIGSNDYPVASVEEVDTLNEEVFGFELSFPRELVANTYTKIEFGRILKAGKVYKYKVESGTTTVITIGYLYTDVTADYVNISTNQEYSITPTKDIYAVNLYSPSGLNVDLKVISTDSLRDSVEKNASDIVSINTKNQKENKIIRLYPFTCSLDTVLTRPNYPAQIVYSADLSGIHFLHIKTSYQTEFRLEQLYAYHSSSHKSVLVVSSIDGNLRLIYQSEARASSDQSTFPTETIHIVNSEDGSTLDAIVDWSKINYQTGIGLDEKYLIDESCISRVLSRCEFVPIDDYYVSGEQQRIYMNELACYDKQGYFMFYSDGASSPEVKSGWNGECQYLEFNVSSSKNITITINYWYKRELVVSKTMTVHAVVGRTLPAKKYMFIGDSLTDAGIYEKKFYDMNSGQVTLYGTRGTAPYNHEGRSGWTSSDYITKQSVRGVTNPFYNPNTETFDFSYYITNNPSFADVECVVIFVGRNDGFVQGTVNNMNTMIASILAYNSSIKCYVMGGYNVACNDSGAGRNLQSSSRMNSNSFIYNKNIFYATYPNAFAKPIPAHLNLDNKYDYSSTTQNVSVVDNRQMEVYVDNVHPSSIGYEKFGMAINGFFHYEFKDEE